MHLTQEHGFSVVKSYEAARARLLLQDRDIFITPGTNSLPFSNEFPAPSPRTVLNECTQR